ncbi:hypothetical protein [Mesorhizobium abyssinicae]|uniref:hypothetical protein n=1 Tax=Mesorhizobium abyssinicae TaxID=1209958 RepID=UPI0033947F78
MPDGPLSEVAQGLVTSNPRETGRNLGAFKSSGRATRQAFEGTELGRFDERNNQLGRAAVGLYDNALEGAVNGMDANRGFARYQTVAVRDIVDFQSPQKQSALVDKVLGIAESRAQAMAISKTAPAWDKFNSESRERLIERAINLVENTNDFITKHNTAAALIKGYDQLNANQQQRVPMSELQQMAMDVSRPQRAEGRSSHLDSTIADAVSAANQVRQGEALGSAAQFGKVAEISASVSRAQQQARDELMESQRTRGRSGR